VKLDSMHALYLAQLRDMHSAEKQLVAALPKLAKTATAPELAAAFEQHLEETKGHLDRINTILDSLGEKPGRDRCEAMAGLIEEGKEIIDAQGEDHVRDAALIVAAQKVEHYEIASYGSLCTHAKLLGRTADHKLLGDTLEEEKRTDQSLTQLAQSHINADAARAPSVTTRGGSHARSSG
jgi:ferritin-like metal-binding protein YciE